MEEEKNWCAAELKKAFARIQCWLSWETWPPTQTARWKNAKFFLSWICNSYRMQSLALNIHFILTIRKNKSIQIGFLHTLGTNLCDHVCLCAVCGRFCDLVVSLCEQYNIVVHRMTTGVCLAYISFDSSEKLWVSVNHAIHKHSHTRWQRIEPIPRKSFSRYPYSDHGAPTTTWDYTQHTQEHSNTQRHIYARANTHTM